MVPTVSEREFRIIREMLHAAAGISLSPEKRAMVSGRLAKRLRHHGFASFAEYLKLLANGGTAELQVAVDLLTTNETHFFREPAHFEFLRHELAERKAAGPVKVWSAACSSGEEPYTIAMTLADVLGERPWEVHASDISSRVLEKARNAIYTRERLKSVPAHLFKAYFLRGVGSQAGNFQVAPELRSRVRFSQVNLNAPLPRMGHFDFIFLRNVLIYFDNATKREVVERLAAQLAPTGLLIVGHAESLNGVTQQLKAIRPTIYRREAAVERRA